MKHSIFAESVSNLDLTPAQFESLCQLHQALCEGHWSDIKDSMRKINETYHDMCHHGNGAIRTGLKAAAIAGLGYMGAHSLGSSDTQSVSDTMDDGPHICKYDEVSEPSYFNGLDFNTGYTMPEDTVAVKSDDTDEIPPDSIIAPPMVDENDLSYGDTDTTDYHGRLNHMSLYQDWYDTLKSFPESVGEYADYIMETKSNLITLTRSEAEQYAKWIIKYSHQFDVPSAIALAIFATESHFNKNAVNGVHKGMGQVGPDALIDVCRLLHLNKDTIDLFDPETNIKFTIRYFKWCTERPDTQYRLDLALARYNGGTHREADLRDMKNGTKTYDDIRTKIKGFRETCANDANLFTHISNITGLDFFIPPHEKAFKDIGRKRDTVKRRKK